VSATANAAAPKPSSHQAASRLQRTIANAATATTIRTRSPIGYDRFVTVAAKLSPPAAESTSSSATAENTAPAASEVTSPSSQTDAGNRFALPRASMIRPA
jgi:hypothetical protein